MSANVESLVQRLTAHRTLSTAPPHEIDWVARHGKLRMLDAGEVLTSKNGKVEGLHIVLSGYLSIHVDHGAGPRKILEWRAGDVTGLMPYSRLVAPPGDVVAQEPSEIVTIARADMAEMIRECQGLTATLVHVMIDRAKLFTSSYLQDEKLVSLGKLAAGLAHELNNPAAAIGRSAGELRTAFSCLDEAFHALGASGFQEAQLSALNRVRDACLAEGGQRILSPLEQEDRENSFTGWLKAHSADRNLADSLAETVVTLDMLDELAKVLHGESLNVALRWIAADYRARRLTWEIHEAASRISQLVGAVKGFTRMDRAAVPEVVDLARGLEDTLAVLGSKARDKSAAVTLDIDPKLPAVCGFAGELNQVWSNLIDNALDAVGKNGQIRITAAQEGASIVIRVIDNGSGIPAEVQDRIFDPFFTTKPVGEGTGLGLDIARRLVHRHNGQIELDSRPGHTEFRVKLPIVDAMTKEHP